MPDVTPLPDWDAAIESLSLDPSEGLCLYYVHLPFGTEVGGEADLETLLDTVRREGIAHFRAHGACEAFHTAGDDLVFACSLSPQIGYAELLNEFEASLQTSLPRLLEALPRASERAVTTCLAASPVAPTPEVSRTRAMARAIRSLQLQCWRPEAAARNSDGRRLDRALNARAFEFHFQPIVDVAAGHVIAYEALCRGTMPDFRFPDLIFKTAEGCNRVWDLGHVLRDVAGDASQALHTSAQGGRMLFLNLHPRDIIDPTFLPQTLDGPLADHANEIVFELTERAAVDDYQNLRKLFTQLRARGYRIAIDDLGSGYAGLTALAEIEPEFIKFDMGLVRDLHLRPIKQQLIERIVGLAREMNATTISEGVECAEERDALRCCGSTVMQGYYFAKPAPGFTELTPRAISG